MSKYRQINKLYCETIKGWGKYGGGGVGNEIFCVESTDTTKVFVWKKF